MREKLLIMRFQGRVQPRTVHTPFGDAINADNCACDKCDVFRKAYCINGDWYLICQENTFYHFFDKERCQWKYQRYVIDSLMLHLESGTYISPDEAERIITEPSNVGECNAILQRGKKCGTSGFVKGPRKTYVCRRHAKPKFL